MYILVLCSPWGTLRIWPACMSCMVLFWASTDFGSVPIWGPRPKPRRPEEVVYILNDSCSHFTQRLFRPKVPQQHKKINSYSTLQYHSYLLYITFICTFTSLFYTSYPYLHFFWSSLQAGCPRILVSNTVLPLFNAIFSLASFCNFSGFEISIKFFVFWKLWSFCILKAQKKGNRLLWLCCWYSLCNHSKVGIIILLTSLHPNVL